jgi:hypothetical protein
VWTAPAGIDSSPLNGIACPSVALCVAVDADGHVLTSTNPLAGARTWHSTDIDNDYSITSVSCPAASLCAAVDGQGNALASTDPTGGTPAWAIARVDTSITEPSPFGGGPGLLRGVSCPTVSFCVAVDSVGNAVYSDNPATGTAPAWATVHIDDNSDYGCQGGGMTCQAPLMGVSCPSASLCVAADFTGNILQTSTPTASAPWPSDYSGGGGAQSLWSVSCPTLGFCATVDGSSGNDFTWNPAAGSHPAAHRLPIDAFGVWCSSASLCLAAGEDPHGVAELVGSTNPGARTPRWNVTDFGDINDVSCPTPSLCLAVDDQGQVMSGVTVASLTSTLRRHAIGSRVPRIGSLVHNGGYRFRLAAQLAGAVQIKWEAEGTVLATGTAQFTSPQTRTVALRLTPAGRTLLKHASRFTLMAIATYNTNTGFVSTQRKLTLRG